MKNRQRVKLDRKQEQAAKEWNRLYPVGTPVYFIVGNFDCSQLLLTTSKAKSFGFFSAVQLEDGIWHKLPSTFPAVPRR